MKTKRTLLLLLTVCGLCSCDTTTKLPLSLSYEGAVGGHAYTAGYNHTTGAVLVVKQK
jgi:hypothetical protein